jgi:hypothetical protein
MRDGRYILLVLMAVRRSMNRTIVGEILALSLSFPMSRRSLACLGCTLESHR